jgi:hypothetical protein
MVASVFKVQLFPTIFSPVKLVYYCDFFDEELTLPYPSSVVFHTLMLSYVHMCLVSLG